MLEKSNITLYYIGLVFNFEIPFTKKNTPIETLSKKFLKKVDFVSNLTDINLKLTTSHDNMFYKNLEFNNYAHYKKKSIPKPSPAFLELDEGGIHVQIDVNDRLAFNIKKDYETDKGILLKLFDLLKNSYKEIPKMIEV